MGRRKRWKEEREVYVAIATSVSLRPTLTRKTLTLPFQPRTSRILSAYGAHIAVYILLAGEPLEPSSRCRKLISQRGNRRCTR